MSEKAFVTLHPAVQAVIVIAIAAVVCVFFWQMWKTFREA